MPAPLVGTTTVPGDKSVTHRAILLGALAEGETSVHGALDALDTRATAGVVTALGAEVRWDADGLRVTGVEPLATPNEPLRCQNAATAARLLIGVLAGRPGTWTLDGDDSLRRRPMDRVCAPLRAAGARIDGDRLPLTVTGTALAGSRHVVELPSAQVKGALLLSGLAAKGPTTVCQHIPTRDHTERMLPQFGITLDVDPGAITVHPGRPRAAALDVPGDPSSAAFLVVAALLTEGSDLLLTDVGLWPRRTGFLRALDRAGADVMVMHRDGREPRGDLRVRACELAAFDIEPEDVPDLVDEVPILALAAARATGTSRFAGLSELRVKESDRIVGIATLLRDLGVDVAVVEDGLVIEGVGGDVLAPPSRVDSADHRLALTATVAAHLSGARARVPSSAAVSFPGFDRSLGAVTGNA